MKWIVQARRYDSKETSTTHLALTFTLAKKVGKMFDAYQSHFELHFQANVFGIDRVSGINVEPSDWYAPTFQEIKPKNVKLISNGLNKIIKLGNITPDKVIEVLNAVLVKSSKEEFWMKEVCNDVSCLVAPNNI